MLYLTGINCAQNGEALIKYGERGDKLYLIRYGKVRILRPDDSVPGGRVEVAKLGRGNLVGERTVVTGKHGTLTLFKCCLVVCMHAAAQFVTIPPQPFHPASFYGLQLALLTVTGCSLKALGSTKAEESLQHCHAVTLQMENIQSPYVSFAVCMSFATTNVPVASVSAFLCA